MSSQSNKRSLEYLEQEMRKSKFFHKDYHPMKFKEGDPAVKIIN